MKFMGGHSPWWKLRCPPQQWALVYGTVLGLEKRQYLNKNLLAQLANQRPSQAREGSFSPVNNKCNTTSGEEEHRSRIYIQAPSFVLFLNTLEPCLFLFHFVCHLKSTPKFQSLSPSSYLPLCVDQSITFFQPQSSQPCWNLPSGTSLQSERNSFSGGKILVTS